MECHFQVLSEPMETECSEPMEYSDADGAGDTVETPSSSQADTNDTQELPCEDLPKTNTVLVCPTDPDQFVYESMESGEKKIQQIECMEKVLHL